MPTYRFDLNEEYGKRLEQDAEDNMMTVQDYSALDFFRQKTFSQCWNW